MRVLALSAYDDDRYLAEMWEAGAWGYLLCAVVIRHPLQLAVGVVGVGGGVAVGVGPPDAVPGGVVEAGTAALAIVPVSFSVFRRVGDTDQAVDGIVPVDGGMP